MEPRDETTDDGAQPAGGTSTAHPRRRASRREAAHRAGNGAEPPAGRPHWPL